MVVGPKSRPPGQVQCRPCRGKSAKPKSQTGRKLLIDTYRFCLACGSKFRAGSVGARTCSPSCTSRLVQTTRRGIPLVKVRKADLPAWQRAQDAIRSSRRQSAVRIGKVEDVDPLRVFDRDRWKCHLCGRKVDRMLPGIDRLGPTLDHLVPLSEGGEHSYANVRLAHRSCNSGKGTGSRPGGEQLALLG